MKRIRFLFLTLAALSIIFSAIPLAAKSTARDLTPLVYLPLLLTSGCDGLSGVSYQAIGVLPPPTDRPAEQHADLNLALRSYLPTTNTLGLVDYGGPVDGRGPKLFSLFTDNRVPVFSSVARVNSWNWATNTRGAPIDYPPVTLAGMLVAPNEILRVPHSEYNIGANTARPERAVFADSPADDPMRFEVLVLYASDDRITLKYTREDNVIRGYTLHVENVCVAPDLLELYRTMNTAGRSQLPALKQGQAFGRAMSNEIGIVIRDNGTFMDPRARKDWW